MEPSSTKKYALSHSGYHTTKEPAISSRIRFDNSTRDDDLNRLSKSKPFIEHMKIGMLLIHLEVTNFDAEPDFCNDRRIIHSSAGDGARGEGRRR